MFLPNIVTKAKLDKLKKLKFLMFRLNQSYQYAGRQPAFLLRGPPGTAGTPGRDGRDGRDGSQGARGNLCCGGAN